MLLFPYQVAFRVCVRCILSEWPSLHKRGKDNGPYEKKRREVHKKFEQERCDIDWDEWYGDDSNWRSTALGGGEAINHNAP